MQVQGTSTAPQPQTEDRVERIFRAFELRKNTDLNGLLHTCRKMAEAFRLLAEKGPDYPSVDRLLELVTQQTEKLLDECQARMPPGAHLLDHLDCRVMLLGIPTPEGCATVLLSDSNCDANTPEETIYMSGITQAYLVVALIKRLGWNNAVMSFHFVHPEDTLRVVASLD